MPQPFGVCAILLNSKNQILLGKRKNCYKAGFFGLPGGRFNLNEPLETAVIREVIEETGIKNASFKYVGVVRENQGDYDFIHFVYTSNVGDTKPELCEPDKCEGWQWFDPKVINQILPGHKAAIELLMTGEKILDITR